MSSRSNIAIKGQRILDFETINHTLNSIAYFQNIDLSAIKIERLGGLSNKNYKIQVDEDLYLFKIPHHIILSAEIDRLAEINNLRRLESLSLAPEILFADISGIQVRRFIPGKTLKSLREEPEAAAQALLNLHSLGPFFENQTDLQNILGRYMNVLDQKKAEREKEYVRALNLADTVLSHLRQLQLPLTACHNDLHAGNLLHTKTQPFLLDWEFAGNHYTHYDIGYLFLTEGFDEGQKKSFMDIYYQGHFVVRDWDLVEICQFVARVVIATRMKFLMRCATESPASTFEKRFWEILGPVVETQEISRLSRVLDTL